MSKLKPGLGRGLDALINPNFKEGTDSPLTVSSKEIKKDDGKSYDILAMIPVGIIEPNPYQPRTDFDPDALEELKKSILQNGLIQPITVRRISPENYQLISGERRLRACTDIGYKDIPAYIIKVETKEAMLALSLIENIQREKLNPIEVAFAYKRLLEECNLSQEQVAERVGKDRTTITNSIRLLKLPKEIQESIIDNSISAGHARALINLPTDKLKIKFLNKITNEHLSVRKVENLVQNYLKKSTKEKLAPTVPDIPDSDSASKNSIENYLRGVLGTKVTLKVKKDNTGNIIIDFYSNDELERLFELFSYIEKNNN
ncbi:MAG: ParB/RepB/Spo0J family partition protein [Ignavibacteria bacterium]|jgi:ParB family chromosome partitioning protein